MSNPIPVPDANKVRTLLDVLFDGLDVKAQAKFDPSQSDTSWHGVFVLDSGVPVALCSADAGLSAGLGAALSMLPVAAAKEAAASRRIEGVMVDNLREIMNICSRLLMDHDSPHLKLEQIYWGKSLPASATALMSTPKVRAQFLLAVPRYGGGAMSFAVGG